MTVRSIPAWRPGCDAWAQPTRAAHAGKGHHHHPGAEESGPHSAHWLAAHPTLRPRRPPPPKPRRPRQRRAHAAAGDEDELEFHDQDEDGGIVRFRESAPDCQDEQDDGEQERSRHERLGLAQLYCEEDEQAREREAARLLGRRERQARREPAEPHVALQRFVDACAAALACRGGVPRPAASLQKDKLRLLEALPDGAPLESGGLARVRERLLALPPGLAHGASPSLNRMMPLLLLQMLQLRRSPDQIEEAIARTRLPSAGQTRDAT